MNASANGNPYSSNPAYTNGNAQHGDVTKEVYVDIRKVNSDKKVFAEKKEMAEKKRKDRNAREQQRSLKISTQINILKNILEDSGFAVKCSKFNVLAGVQDYCLSLKYNYNSLINECRKLDAKLGNITSELPVNNEEAPAGWPSIAKHPVPHELGPVQRLDQEKVEPNIMFSSILFHLPHPIAVATLCGKMSAGNKQFTNLVKIVSPMSDHSKKTAGDSRIVASNVFSLIDPCCVNSARELVDKMVTARYWDIFRKKRSVSSILCPAVSPISEPPKDVPSFIREDSILISVDNKALHLSMSVMCDEDGNPQNLNCIFIPADTICA
jgi:hypothetical protein